MPIIESPVKRWKGKIILPDALTMPQYVAFMEAQYDAQETVSVPSKLLKVLPGVLVCVERWELDGGFPAEVTLQNFPATPAAAVTKLLTAVVMGIWSLINEADDSPLP